MELEAASPEAAQPHSYASLHKLEDWKRRAENPELIAAENRATRPWLNE
jgi:hypothetical protein